MKQLVVLSGKGGTGKTTVTASLRRILPGVMAADCDVDAANLLLLSPGHRVLESHDYQGGLKASVRDSLCLSCGKCRDVCRFDAVTTRNGKWIIDPFACEGCGACELVCPAGAIALTRSTAGHYTYGESEGSGLSSGDLYPGEETSGGLVMKVKELAVKKALEKKNPLVLADGAPGIACPAISSLSGADYALLVTEPGVSGLHDLTRALELMRGFRIRCGIVVNKSDILQEITERILSVCRERGCDILGTVPFDPSVADSARRGVPVIDSPESPAARAILLVAAALERILEEINQEDHHVPSRNPRAGEKSAVPNQ